MPREIDFAELTLMDALDLAILIEEEAEERYQEFAAQMEAFYTPEAARFFRFMSANEARHGQDLRARREDRFGDAPAAIDRTMLWDVEAPAYDRARAFISPRKVLEIALDSEIKAHDFFDRALPHIADPDVRQLFEELRGEEIEHQDLVRKKLAEEPPDTGRRAEEDMDEPHEM